MGCFNSGEHGYTIDAGLQAVIPQGMFVLLWHSKKIDSGINGFILSWLIKAKQNKQKKGDLASAVRNPELMLSTESLCLFGTWQITANTYLYLYLYLFWKIL